MIDEGCTQLIANGTTGEKIKEGTYGKSLLDGGSCYEH